MAKGPAAEFIFRYWYPKPGDEEEHANFVKSLRENDWSQWPTKEEIDDESFHMLMPNHWRRKPFIRCCTMQDFWNVKNKEEWAARREASKEEKKRKERNWGYNTTRASSENYHHDFHYGYEPHSYGHNQPWEKNW